MKKVVLLKDGKEILGSDGISHIDGRFNHNSVVNYLLDRNKRYANLPHLIATEFYYTDNKYNRTSKNHNIQ